MAKESEKAPLKEPEVVQPKKEEPKVVAEAEVEEEVKEEQKERPKKKKKKKPVVTNFNDLEKYWEQMGSAKQTEVKVVYVENQNSNGPSFRN